MLAGGDADVDIEMLEAATFALLVAHDVEREFVYRRTPRDRWAAPRRWAGRWSA